MPKNEKKGKKNNLEASAGERVGGRQCIPKVLEIVQDKSEALLWVEKFPGRGSRSGNQFLNWPFFII